MVGAHGASVPDLLKLSTIYADKYHGGAMGASTTRRALRAAEAWALMLELITSPSGASWRSRRSSTSRRRRSCALRQLDPDEPKPMSELAAALRCDNSNVTGIVDRLEDRGLVERRPARARPAGQDADDHRARARRSARASPPAWTSRPRRWPASRPRTSARCATSCAAPSVAPDTLLRIGDPLCDAARAAVGTASPRTTPRRERWVARAALIVRT